MKVWHSNGLRRGAQACCLCLLDYLSLRASPARKAFLRGDDMPTITVKDGNTIYYKDWGTGSRLRFRMVGR